MKSLNWTFLLGAILLSPMAFGDGAVSVVEPAPVSSAQDYDQCIAECEGYWKINADAKPSNTSQVCKNSSVEQIAQILNSDHCQDGAIRAIEDVPATIAAYGTMVKNVGAYIRQKAEDRNHLIDACNADVNCKIEQLRKLPLYSEKTADGKWKITDAKIEAVANKRDMLDILADLETHEAEDRTACNRLYARLIVDYADHHIGAPAYERDLHDYLALAQADPHCLGVLQVKMPLPHDFRTHPGTGWLHSLGVKTNCYEPDKMADLLCYEVYHLALDPLNLVGVGLVSKTLRVAGLVRKSAEIAGDLPLVALPAPTARRVGELTDGTRIYEGNGLTVYVRDGGGGAGDVIAPAAREAKPSPPKKDFSLEKNSDEARLKRAERYAQKRSSFLLDWSRENEEKILGRKLTDQEFNMLEYLFWVPEKERLAYINAVKTFTPADKFKILRKYVSLEATERSALDLGLHWMRQINKEKGVTSASLDVGSESRFKNLENRMRKAENKLVFTHEEEKEDFFNFRYFTPNDLKLIYKSNRNPKIVEAAESGKLDPRIPVQGDYERVLSIINDYGTPKFKWFNKNFGHLDAGGSNIFSLRMRPVMEFSDRGNLKELKPDIRALICKLSDGTVRVFKVYRKESHIHEEIFDQAEQEYYQQARDIIAQEHLDCLKPIP